MRKSLKAWRRRRAGRRRRPQNVPELRRAGGWQQPRTLESRIAVGIPGAAATARLHHKRAEHGLRARASSTQARRGERRRDPGCPCLQGEGGDGAACPCHSIKERTFGCTRTRHPKQQSWCHPHPHLSPGLGNVWSRFLGVWAAPQPPERSAEPPHLRGRPVTPPKARRPAPPRTLLGLRRAPTLGSGARTPQRRGHRLADVAAQQAERERRRAATRTELRSGQRAASPASWPPVCARSARCPFGRAPPGTRPIPRRSSAAHL